MMKFLPVRADLKNNLFENVQYLPFVIDLLFKNKKLIADDYFPQEDGELLDFLIEEINSVYPWFIVGIKDGEPLGAAWLTHWHKAGENKYHSCQIQACIDKKFWGKSSLFAISRLLKFLTESTGVKRVQTEIPEFNQRAVAYMQRAGFEKEGIIRCAAFKNGKPLNNILMSIIL